MTCKKREIEKSNAELNVKCHNREFINEIYRETLKNGKKRLVYKVKNSQQAQ